ncbi:hypothetical protein [Paraburkholderia caledonica]|uniref:hypothetical protein n=1 Tax=Paraburkholderia caledonica TaxID=134536 RepID=UPI0038BD1903
MFAHTTLGRLGYVYLRQRAVLAGVLLDQFEKVLRSAARKDDDALRAAEPIASHAGEVLRLDTARGTAKQLAKLGGIQQSIEGVEAR